MDRLEIAFAGRSNVGKSSLINALCGTSGLARTSNTPGRTQELNIFESQSEELRIVDMPGYGFAKAPIKVVDRWKALVRTFLRGRVVLKRTLVLIDSRHGVKDVDREMLKMLDEAAVGYRLVLTKADKIKPHEAEAVRQATLKAISKRPAAYPAVAVTSSEKGTGLPELRAEIMAACAVTP